MENYSYKISWLQILYIASASVDLTGTKIVANKPAAVFSGHECSFVYADNNRPTQRLWPCRVNSTHRIVGYSLLCSSIAG